MSKGIIFDIKKFAIHDGPGIRTTVFFKGCPLNCAWCHNPESRMIEPETICVKTRGRSTNSGKTVKDENFGQEKTVDEVMIEVEKDRVFYEQSGGGVTFSGGEPLLQLEFLTDLLLESRKRGFNTIVDTSGYVDSNDISKIKDLADIFLYDIKLMDDTEHKKYTGVSNKLILDNLNLLVNSKAVVIPRIPLIPGITDTDNNLKDTAGYLSGIKNISKISLLPYNKLAEDKRRKFNMEMNLGRLPSQSEAGLSGMSDIFIKQGFAVSIGG